MEGKSGGSEGTTLRDYVAVVRRRKWVILQALVLVPAAAVFFSLQQEKLYEATSEVLISRQNIAASLTDTLDPTLYQQPDRVIQTQANLARVPVLAERVLDAAGLDQEPQSFLDRSTVSPRQNADLLVFKVRDRRPELAAHLATVYANEFREYRRELDTAAIQRALVEVRTRMDELEQSGDTRSQLYQSLADNESRLKTIESLLTSNAFVVRSATDAEQVQPKPLRNGILGLALALVLGLGLAFLWEALDTRVRSADDLEDALGMPLLARIPEPPRRLRKENRLAMLEAPRGRHAEAFRVLKMNVEFAKLARDIRTIMVTSSVQQEGKSTTLANLALAYARAGESVCIVDLDLRRPFLDKFFDLGDRPGLAQVVLHQVELEQALASVYVPNAGEAPVVAQYANGNGRQRAAGAPGGGVLHVLSAGAVPPNAGELVASELLAAVLADLRDRFDTVLIDAPPALRVGDAMALSSRVDAMFVVTRMNVVRRGMLRELRRALDSAPAAKLGFVVTGAEAEDSYGYGYGYAYGYGDRDADPVEDTREETAKA